MLNLIPPQAGAPYFHYDYLACRDAWLSSIAGIADRQSDNLSWQSNETGEFSCDASWFGEADAGRVLVIISATHGVEGYAGSAIQRYILDCLANGGSLPHGTALVMIHALNPWGMAWARRCDKKGIDVNRNFVDFAHLPKPAPEFPDLLKAFEREDPHERRRELQTLAHEWGQRRYEEVLSGGQFEVAWAPFYGGREPGFSRQCIEQLSSYWQLADRELVVIDLHTGLGPWSYGELISDHPHGSRANDYAFDLFGPAVACTHSGASYSVPKRGLLDFFWHPMMQERGCFLTLEFGTYGTEALFRVLLDDHRFWLRHQEQTPKEFSHAPIREAMLRHFCPQDSFWQQSVLWRSWQVVNRILDQFGKTV